VETTLGDENNTPYFLLPSLGSSSTLRGYRSWRFRDRNMLLTQGEFRWIPNRLGMDMAIFYDAGKVAARRQDLHFTGMAHDWGVGIRLHGPTRTPVRVEIARGSEGVNLIFSGSAVF
jgi:hemolysin activation/secretion protein